MDGVTSLITKIIPKIIAHGVILLMINLTRVDLIMDGELF
jgi:hypothetical protein